MYVHVECGGKQLGGLQANEANAAKAKAAGTDFPAYLKKAAPESFDTKAWGI